MELDNILDYNIGNNIIEMNEFDFFIHILEFM